MKAFLQKLCSPSLLLFSTSFLFLTSCNEVQLGQIGAKYYARELCSCLFVVNHSEQYCRNILKNDNVKMYSVNVDHETKTVSSSVYVLFKAQARWIGPHRGCRLQEID